MQAVQTILIILLVALFVYLMYAQGSYVSRTFAIMWQKKYLWFFGIFCIGFLALSGSISAPFNQVFKSGDQVVSIQDKIDNLHTAVSQGKLDQIWTMTKSIVTHQTGGVIVFTLVVLIFSAVLAIVVVLSQATIMRIVGRIASNQPSTLLEGIAAVMARWKNIALTMGIYILVSIASWFFLVALPATGFFLHSSAHWIRQLASITSGLNAYLVSPLLSFIGIYALGYVVLQDKHGVDAWKFAWRMFIDNILLSAEIAFLIYGLSSVIGYIVLAVATFALFARQATAVGFTSLSLITLAYTALMALMTYTMWTLVYTKLVNGRAESILGKLTTRIVNLANPKKPAA